MINCGDYWQLIKTLTPREWQSSEVSFLSQVSLQFSQAKTQIDYVQTLARAAEQEKAINRIVNRIRQSLDVEDNIPNNYSRNSSGFAMRSRCCISIYTGLGW